MSSLTMTNTVTNVHLNGKVETSLNGHRKNGYLKHESSDKTVSIAFLYTAIIIDYIYLHEHTKPPSEV